MFQIRRPLVGLSLLMLLVLVGCSSGFSPSEPEPKVHLVKVELVKAKLMEQRFVLHFRIENPGDEELTVRGLRYDVALEGIELTEGEIDHWVSIAPRAERNYKVPVRTNLWKELKPLSKLFRHPDRPVHYRLEGELRTGLFYEREVQLQRSGEIIPGDFFPE